MHAQAPPTRADVSAAAASQSSPQSFSIRVRSTSRVERRLLDQPR
jgi:hypothetical protein